MGNCKALVIENEASMQTFLSNQLKQAGINCYAVGTGKEALNMLSLITCDLVLLDLNLPDIWGVTLIDTMKKNGHAHTPVLAYSFEQRHHSMVKPYKVPFLLRPIRLSELFNHINSIIH